MRDSAPAASLAPTCQKIAASFIPRLGMAYACVLAAGHEGDCRPGGTCLTHGPYVGRAGHPPVCPQCPGASVAGAATEGGGVVNAEGVNARVIAELARILARRRAADAGCRCDRCAAAVAAQGHTTCPTCGYTGEFVAVRCACYDAGCPGGDRAGSGCSHGALTCPVCDSGEVDAWAIIREIRATLPSSEGADLTPHEEAHGEARGEAHGEAHGEALGEAHASTASTRAPAATTPAGATPAGATRPAFDAELLQAEHERLLALVHHCPHCRRTESLRRSELDARAAIETAQRSRATPAPR